MDSSTLIITIIIAFTQAIKYLSPKVTGIITMVVAVLVGIIVAALDTNIGLNDITIAQGILFALSGIGVHTVAANIGSRTPTPKV